MCPEDSVQDWRGWTAAFNKKSSQLCCLLRVDWPPENEGEELLWIEREDFLTALVSSIEIKMLLM